MNINYYIYYIYFALTFLSCSKEMNKEQTPTTEPKLDQDRIEDDSSSDLDSLTVKFFNVNRLDNNYVLINDAGNNRVFIINKNGKILHEWKLQGRLGNDAFLLPNGKLLANLEAENPLIKFGGFGGKLQVIDKDNVILWDFNHSSENFISHHDAKMLPNGNILFIAWTKKHAEQSVQAGYKQNIPLFPESILEISPISNQIVWRWNSWDHLIQDVDSTKSNYGDIKMNPHRININYVQMDNGDIMHANGIDYDEVNDLIYLSVNFYSEIWVIDHSTTTSEASTGVGGNYNYGGDLVYRFGNPQAYNNIGPRHFFNNHHPNLLSGNKTGNILVYSNGKEQGQSTVYELKLPNSLNLEIDQNNEPLIEWSYTNSELFSPKVSGAVELPNGNRLITEGDFGLWEVTEEGELVWQYSYPGFFWRSYHYSKDAPEIKYLGL
jgi:hypothetical protein